MPRVYLLSSVIRGSKFYLRRTNCHGVARYNYSNGDIVCFGSIFDAMHARRLLDLPERWHIETFTGKDAV